MIHTTASLLPVLLLCTVVAIADPAQQEREHKMSNDPTTAEKAYDLATFGTGCFWCTEAIIESIPGVKKVQSGYTGGDVENPTYRQVCTGTTGHAEAVRITFDPAVVTYGELLDMFWKMHDPTTLNRQGADSGTQYRSAIFYHSEAQRVAADAAKKQKGASGEFKNPIVTEISPAGEFFVAENYHQDYFKNNSSAPYCRIVIAPKLKKLGIKK